MYKPKLQISTDKLITFLQTLPNNRHIDILELKNWIEINTNYQSTIIRSEYLDILADFAIQLEKSQNLIIRHILLNE